MSNQTDKDIPAADTADESTGSTPAQDSPETQVDDVVAIEDLGAQLEAIATERDRLAAANEELKDRLLRRQADFENFRSEEHTSELQSH